MINNQNKQNVIINDEKTSINLKNFLEKNKISLDNNILNINFNG